jgi:arginyl-tRNA synthetase
VPFPDGGYRGDYLREVAEAAHRELGNNLKPADSGRITSFGLDYLFRENIAVLERMGIRFDRIVRESELISSGVTERAVAELTELGVTRTQDGALWFAPGDEFLGDRESVIVRSTGQPTYFASDIAYHREKFTAGYDLVIDVFGSNHHGHVPKLRALTKLYGFDPKRFTVILYQFVRVKRGDEVVRMSKRAGTYVTAREVLDEVGADSTVFFLLMHAAGSHMDFDLALATEKSAENPVYYAQYAYVRARSILANALSDTPASPHLDRLTNDAELALIRKLAQFPDLVTEIARTFEVHRLPSYALALARSFHSFYERERVLVPDADLAAARLALVSATVNVLGETLRLLGVSRPDKM